MADSPHVIRDDDGREPEIVVHDPGEGLERMAEGLIERVAAGDVGAPFEQWSIQVLRRLRDSYPARYQRVRARLKKQGVMVSDLDKRLGPASRPREDDDETAASGEKYMHN